MWDWISIATLLEVPSNAGITADVFSVDDRRAGEETTGPSTVVRGRHLTGTWWSRGTGHRSVGFSPDMHSTRPLKCPVVVKDGAEQECSGTVCILGSVTELVLGGPSGRVRRSVSVS